MKRYQVRYDKTFLTGALTGLTVPCGFQVAAADVRARVEMLGQATPDHPGKDALTRNKFVISNIAVDAVKK